MLTRMMSALLERLRSVKERWALNRGLAKMQCDGCGKLLNSPQPRRTRVCSDACAEQAISDAEESYNSMW